VKGRWTSEKQSNGQKSRATDRKAEQRTEEQQDWGSTKQDERNRTWVDHGDKKGNRQDDTLASLLKIRIGDNETSRDSLRMNYAYDACMKAIKSTWACQIRHDLQYNGAFLLFGLITRERRSMYPCNRVCMPLQVLYESLLRFRGLYS